MKIAVFGTGTVGRALAGAFSRLGHEVALGTRNPAETAARTGRGAMGEPSFGEWLAEH